MTNPQHVNNGRIGGHTRAARCADPREAIKPARLGWMRRFEHEVDPDGVLPEAERARRADSAMKAYMARLGAKSAQTRRRAAPGGRAA